MANFLQIASGTNTSSLLEELNSHPELWNKNPCRLSEYGPHHETDDIFLRYKDETPNIQSGDFSNFSDPHLPEWYKSIDFLLSAKPLIFDLMAALRGEVLGGVFLYRVLPGKKIYPHVDKGWHPWYYAKFNFCLASNPQAAFCYPEEQELPQRYLIQEPGDVHLFRNDILHEVINEGTTPHIVMTVCIRTDSSYRVPWSPEDWSMDNLILSKQTQQVEGGY